MKSYFTSLPQSLVRSVNQCQLPGCSSGKQCCLSQTKESQNFRFFIFETLMKHSQPYEDQIQRLENVDEEQSRQNRDGSFFAFQFCESFHCRFKKSKKLMNCVIAWEPWEFRRGWFFMNSKLQTLNSKYQNGGGRASPHQSMSQFNRSDHFIYLHTYVQTYGTYQQKKSTNRPSPLTVRKTLKIPTKKKTEIQNPSRFFF